MPRARRDWTAMMVEIRQLIREDTAAFWEDAELLAYFNQSIDLRVMELGEQHEGWITDAVITSVVANQREYTLPEGTGRVKRVVVVYDASTNPVEVPLTRNERWSDSMAQNSGSQGRAGDPPTYRLMNNLVMIEPPIAVAMTNGLRIEVESSPDRLAIGADKLDLRFPDVMETLLIYDCALMALAVEGAQGNMPEGYVDHIQIVQRKYERAFSEYTAQRSHGRVFGDAFNLGD